MSEPKKLNFALPELTEDMIARMDASARESRARDRVSRQKQLMIDGRWPLSRSEVQYLARGGLRPTDAIEIVRKWYKSLESRPILALFGSVGCGKTFAAATWAWSLAEDDWRVQYFTPDTLCARVYPAYRTPEAMMPDLGGAPIVVDDLGTESDKRFSSALFQAVNLHQRRPMILTTNLTVRQFRDRYDDRVIDRLNSCGQAVVVPGRSLRDQSGGFTPGG